MFLVEAQVDGGEVTCLPGREGLVGGMRAVLRACEATLLSLTPLLPYFAPHHR